MTDQVLTPLALTDWAHGLEFGAILPAAIILTAAFTWFASRFFPCVGCRAVYEHENKQIHDALGRDDLRIRRHRWTGRRPYTAGQVLKLLADRDALATKERDERMERALFRTWAGQQMLAEMAQLEEVSGG